MVCRCSPIWSSPQALANGTASPSAAAPWSAQDRRSEFRVAPSGPSAIQVTVPLAASRGRHIAVTSGLARWRRAGRHASNGAEITTSKTHAMINEHAAADPIDG